MAGNGCANEGDDPRLLGKIGCRVANALSWKSTVQPLSVLVCLPPYVAINIPLPFVPASRRYLHLRAGWRYDKFWPGYIFDFAIKAKNIPIFY